MGGGGIECLVFWQVRSGGRRREVLWVPVDAFGVRKSGAVVRIECTEGGQSKGLWESALLAGALGAQDGKEHSHSSFGREVGRKRIRLFDAHAAHTPPTPHMHTQTGTTPRMSIVAARVAGTVLLRSTAAASSSPFSRRGKRKREKQPRFKKHRLHHTCCPLDPPTHPVY